MWIWILARNYASKGNMCAADYFTKSKLPRNECSYDKAKIKKLNELIDYEQGIY